MLSNGHTQCEVSRLTHVNQAEISKILAGQRRTFTRPILKLCKYAHYDADSPMAREDAAERLSQLVRGQLRDNPEAHTVLLHVLEALLPVLREYRPTSTPDRSGHA